MNIEEAIEILKLSKKTFLFGTSQIVTEMEAVDTLLNYIETIHKELDRLEGIEDNTAMLKQELKEQTEANKELNKVLIHFKAIINEMADYIAELDVDEDICKNIEHCASDKKLCRECIKEYFYNKAQK